LTKLAENGSDRERKRVKRGGGEEVRDAEDPVSPWREDNRGAALSLHYPKYAAEQRFSVCSNTGLSIHL
jgi:hypothetical protein